MSLEQLSPLQRAPQTRAAPAHATLTRPVTLLFATTAGFAVANVYYAQPLLDTLAHQFDISRAAIGGI
ncbi:MFS transporter, partial [Pseudomonas sp. MWU13-2625]